MDYRTGDILAYVGSAGYYRKENARVRAQGTTTPGRVGASPARPGSPSSTPPGSIRARFTAGTVLLDNQDAVRPGLDAQERRWGGPGIHARVAGRDPVLAQHPGHPGARATGHHDRPQVRREGRLHVPHRHGDRMLDVAGLAGALGTVEVRPARHDGRLRRLRQRRQGHQATPHPEGAGTRRRGHLPGRQARHDAGLEPAGGLHHGRHPQGQHEPRREPGVGCGLRDAQHAGWLAPRGGGQDGHDQRAEGLLDLRHPADAREQEAARARGRRVVRQQRQLEPQPRPPALLAGQRRPDLGGLRARLHERQARPRLQAAQGSRRRPWVGALHPGHAARRPTAGRHDGTDDYDDA